MRKLSFEEFIQKCSEQNVIVNLDETFVKMRPTLKKAIKYINDNNRIIIKKDRQVGCSTMIVLYMIYNFLYIEKDTVFGLAYPTMSGSRELRRWFDYHLEIIIREFNYDGEIKKEKDNRRFLDFIINGYKKTIHSLCASGFYCGTRGISFDCLVLEDVDVWSDQTVANIIDMYSASRYNKIIITGEVPTIYDECYRGAKISKLMGEYLKSDKFKKIYLFSRPFGVGEID